MEEKKKDAPETYPEPLVYDRDANAPELDFSKVEPEVGLL